MAAYSDQREVLLAKIWDGLGPSRWHPIRRRKWRKITEGWVGEADLSHWSSQRLSDEYVDTVLRPAMGAITDDLAESLPDGFMVGFDGDMLGEGS